MMKKSRNLVGFIGGFSRSGSTLLDRLIGQADGFVSTGELDRIWSYGVSENNKCACGELFSSCPKWSMVVDQIFQTDDHIQEADDRIRLRSRIRIRHLLPMALLTWMGRAQRVNVRKFSIGYLTLYAAIKRVFSCEVLVDSSKSPLIPFLLHTNTNLGVKVIHIVRDPRAVAYSMSRVKPSLERKNGRERNIQQLNTFSTTWRWITWNLLFEFLALVGLSVLRVRYEDLVQKTDQELSRIGNFIGRTLECDEYATLSNHKFELKTCHNVAGNPMRFKTGMVDLALDIKWQKNMSRTQSTFVKVMTWPLMLSYGYSLLD
jgi:hypothetical protein